MEKYGVSLKTIDDIKVGDEAYYSKTVTEGDVMVFAQLSGDYAPHHVNKEFGLSTMYHSRIAHGMLSAGIICPVLNRLCGDASITSEQEIKFKSAVLIGDTIIVKGTVTGIDTEKNEIMIDIVCTNQNFKEGDRPVILARFVQRIVELID